MKSSLRFTLVSAALLSVYSVATAFIIQEEGRMTVPVLLMILSVVSLFVCWGRFCSKQRRVLERLSSITGDISEITRHPDPGLRLEHGGNKDELSPLIGAINRMLDSIASYQSALNESESRYRALFERAPDSIFILTADSDDLGTVVAANRAAAEMRGIPREEFTGMLFSSLCSPESVATCEQLLQRTIEKENVTGELWHVRRDGSVFPLEIHAGLLQLGTRRLILTFDRDITARRTAEEQLRNLNSELSRKANDMAALNRELEAFNYSVSHDIRGPLTRISGYCQIMLEDAERLPTDFREYLSRIYESSCWLDEMVDAMLDLSRLSSAEFLSVRLDLSGMVADLLDELTVAEPGRVVEMVIQPGIQVEGDANLLRIVMSNLVGNAWKYTGGCERTLIEFGARSDGGGVPVYYVRDNGIGFDNKNAEKIFRVFTRLPGSSQFAGSGIGLATVQRIVTRHGGKVWAEGAVGQGATFYFTLGSAAIPTAPD